MPLASRTPQTWPQLQAAINDGVVLQTRTDGRRIKYYVGHATGLQECRRTHPAPLEECRRKQGATANHNLLCCTYAPAIAELDTKSSR